ncbi:hypothetical protein OBV_31760 [Oscillibacter valericigenes Sjm18-20]|nr:hypothetical protein OBV_31760 [Oscillibacter valericigenes Sjm18-20]
MEGDLSDFTYVAVHTRLMLLRKYTRNGRGSLHLTDIIAKAICKFPQHTDYLSELMKRFIQSCDQSLNHVLADGTDRTLDESIDDIMYGLHLHADEERIKRIIQDNNLLRLYCAEIFVKEIEALAIELSNFLDANGIHCIEKTNHLSAPVIHLDAQGSDTRNITGSPFWKNLIGSDMTEESTQTLFSKYFALEQFSCDEMKQLVFEPTSNDRGDFSKVIAYYKAIPSPGMSATIRYNEQRDAAYIHIYPHVEEGFIVDSPQIISDVYVITLIKDQRLGEWRVFAFGGRLDPHIRN